MRPRPAIADAAYATVTLATVERALQLTATEMAIVDDPGCQPKLGVFHVEGGGGPHWVNLYDPQAPRCDCYDHLGRENVCKHLVRVLIDLGDQRLRNRLHRLASEAWALE